MSSLSSDFDIDFVRCIAVQSISRLQLILMAYKVLKTKINLNNKRKTLSFNIEIAEAEVTLNQNANQTNSAASEFVAGLY